MNSNALAFLKAVLPDRGLYVAWTKVNQRRSYNTVLPTLDALLAHMLSEDGQGKSVYHACASYNDQNGVWNEKKAKFEVRCQANVHAVRALWLDVDAGPQKIRADKGYADAIDAAEAIQKFCGTVQLPPPIYVGSGSGVHAYWPLAEHLSLEQWLRYSAGLKRLALLHRLRSDPARTTDGASVLRTPGTRNSKSGVALEVQCGPLEGPYPLSAFAHLLETPANEQPAAFTAQPSAPQRPIAAAMAAQQYDPCYSDNVADACAQVALLRDTMGNLPEPQWYAALGVLSRCVDGDECAHEWSAGYAGYSFDETDSKLQRTLALTGPTTCQKFESLNPEGCASCPFRGKITSPITLGRDSVEPSPTSFGSTAEVLVLQLPAHILAALYSQPLPIVPLPWNWSEAKQLVQQTSKSDANVDLLVSQFPIFLHGVQIGEANGSKFSYHFKQFLPHKGWIDIMIPAKVLMGNAGIAEMFDKGATIHDPKSFAGYVRHAVDVFHRDEKLRTRYDQFGWKDNDTEFLLGKRLYTATDVHDTLGSEEVKTRSQWLMPKEGGSLERWSNAANALFQQGCEVQSFALVCSFAAPLMRFHATDEGGAIVSLNSRESGSGKSTTLGAVASVWGTVKGLALTNIDTHVSKALTLGVLSNLPVIYDELTNRDPEVIREFVLMFTNGRDKMRGTSDGEIRHTQANWQTLLISTSNASLVDILQHASGVDALAFRAMELPLHLPEHIAHRKGDALRKELEANAGHAGDAYLRYLLQPAVLAWTRAALLQWTNEIWEHTQLRAEHRFWVRTLGSVAVASALVNKMGILAFQPSRIMEWAVDFVTNGMDDAPVTSGKHGDPAMSIGALGEFFSDHLSDTLIVERAYVPGDRHLAPLMKPARKLLIRFERSNGRILISDRALREWLLRREVGYRQFIQELKDAQVVLHARRPVTLSAGTDFPGGQQPCVEINAFHPALSGVIMNITDLQTRRQDNVVPMIR